MFLNLPRSEVRKECLLLFLCGKDSIHHEVQPTSKEFRKKPVGEKAPFPTDEVQPPWKAWYNIQLANVQETFCHALFT